MKNIFLIGVSILLVSLAFLPFVLEYCFSLWRLKKSRDFLMDRIGILYGRKYMGFSMCSGDVYLYGNDCELFFVFRKNSGGLRSAIFVGEISRYESSDMWIIPVEIFNYFGLILGRVKQREQIGKYQCLGLSKKLQDYVKSSVIGDKVYMEVSDGMCLVIKN
jgi:hypothetical protein